MIDVDLVFGGIVIYRWEAFSAGRYAVTEKKGSFNVADHIPFHEDLRAKGYKIYINCARYPVATESISPKS